MSSAKRPVQWSISSLIFTAHPTQPLVVARIFANSAQFHLPSPDPIISSLNPSYLPPTVITVSPTDRYLFAYFPAREGDGVACFWSRGDHVDSWTVKESWTLPPDSQVVTAAWVDPLRPLESTGPGSYTRLPPRGPQFAIADPILFLVTQAQQLHAYFYRYPNPRLHTLTSSLRVDGQLNPLPDVAETSGGSRVCIHGAIGFGYNEKSILVATRSRLYPSQIERLQTSFGGLEMSVTSSKSEDPTLSTPDEWNAWGEEDVIEICQAKLVFSDENLTLSVVPLPSVRHSGNLLDLIFAQPYIPETQPGDSKFYLVASFLQPGNNTKESPPTSELVTYSVSQNVSGAPDIRWVSRRENTRSFAPGIIGFVIPSLHHRGIYVGILGFSPGSNTTKATRAKNVTCGVIKALTLPDLQDDGGWEEAKIIGPVDAIARQVPFSAAISPNHSLICLISSSLWTSHQSIQPGPKPHTEFAERLIVAVYNRRTTFDLTRSLSLPSVSEGEVSGILEGLFRACDSMPRNAASLLRESLGAVVEILRDRAIRCVDTEEKELLDARWRAIHDVCSLTAGCEAFDACLENSTYDTDALWQLVALASWVIGRVEELAKICVRTADAFAALNYSGDTESQHEEGKTPFHPILLFLYHPFAFLTFKHNVEQVNVLRSHLTGSQPRGHSDSIARHTLIDALDSSGVDLVQFETILNEHQEELFRHAKPDLARRILATCQPTEVYKPVLRHFVQKISSSQAVDKARLFVKPGDLVGSFAHEKDEKERDVVTRGQLLTRGKWSLCLRCGGKSEVGSEGGMKSRSPRWTAWAGYSTSLCVCFGPWASGSITV